VTAAAAELFEDRFPLVRRYVDALGSRGLEWGLIGPREVDRLWERHILNSAALSQLIAARAEVVDVGSGAGLPGLPLAILRPDLQVVLLEPLLRRSEFLTQVVDELGIAGQVRVVRSRAEDHQARYDAVVSRALAPLDRLVRWCTHLRRQDGLILALKGRTATDEIRSATPTINAAGLTATALTVRAHPSAETTTVVRLAAR